MVAAKTKVIVFAAIIGISFIQIPYINQQAIPVVKIIYIPNEIPLVSFVFNI